MNLYVLAGLGQNAEINNNIKLFLKRYSVLKCCRNYKHDDYQPKNQKTASYLGDKSFVLHIVTATFLAFPKPHSDTESNDVHLFSLRSEYIDVCGVKQFFQSVRNVWTLFMQIEINK